MSSGVCDLSELLIIWLPDITPPLELGDQCGLFLLLPGSIQGQPGVAASQVSLCFRGSVMRLPSLGQRRTDGKEAPLGTSSQNVGLWQVPCCWPGVGHSVGQRVEAFAMFCVSAEQRFRCLLSPAGGKPQAQVSVEDIQRTLGGREWNGDRPGCVPPQLCHFEPVPSGAVVSICLSKCLVCMLNNWLGLSC